MRTRTLLILLSVIANMTMAVRAQDKPIAQACQQTAFDLFNKLAENPEAPDNLCFSPLSAQIALSMVSNGAAGETLREMQETLGTYGYSNDEVNAFYKSLTASITTRPLYDPTDWGDEEGIDGYNAAYPVCEIANSVWYRPDISLYESFTDLIKATYDAGFGSVRFDTEEGIGIINNWVNTKTHGLIPTIYAEPQSPNLAVMLADALYFKGSWKHPFDKKLTKPGVFHLGNGMAVNTDMMTTSSDYCLSKTPNFNAITIPYGIGDFSMTLFVPVKGTALPTLTFEDWAVTMSENAKNKPVSLYLPKFSIKGKHDLKPVLQDLGMNLAFSLDADFSRMSPDGLLIDKAYQLDNITVDEDGTEAAAVTVIEMIKNGGVSDYEEFRVDRPFYFTIESRKEKAVLFVGRVATLEGEPAGQEPGDVNGDGATDISDVVAIINVIARTDDNGSADVKSAAAAKAKSDVNGDGKTDISDIVAVINIIADSTPALDLTHIRIKENPGETLEYIGKIGNDFGTALDSLKALKGISSETIKEPLEVIFDYDDRLFFGIIYGDCGMYSDVIDTKGNYYLRTWYSSDDGMTDGVISPAINKNN